MEKRKQYRVGWAREGDDAELRRLLRETPMAGEIRVTMEREPDYFEAEKREGALAGHTVVAREEASGRLAAMSSRVVHEVYVNGEAARVGYLGQLRVAPGWRARVGTLARQGFEWLESTRRADEMPFDFTTIVDDNKPALRLLTSGLPGFPVYREIGRIRTSLFSVRAPGIPWEDLGTRPAVRPVGAAECEAMFACLDRFGRRHQLARRWDSVESLRRCGLEPEDFLCVVGSDPGGGGVRVCGCAVVWDQRRFKQVVVRGYSPVTAERAEAMARFSSALPRPGELLACAFFSHLAVDDDDPEVFRALLAAAIGQCRETTDLQWLVLGLAENHPLMKAVKRLEPWTYGSILFAVHPPGGEVELDGRIPHVEVACL